MLLETASITELSIAVIGILGAVGGVIKASNCKKVSVCKIIECEKGEDEISPTETELTEIDKNKPISNKIELKNQIEGKV
tara:strand:+ start:561 stop:800 length:240 start_codon:yes stop_codon:yes gene_type:complete